MDDDITLMVDIHEKHSMIASSLKVLDVPIILEHREVGDVTIFYHPSSFAVPIEIKRASDLCNSLYDGRLHSQLVEMYNTYNFPILIIEGLDERGNADMQRTINTLNLRLPVYQTDNQAETVELIGEFIRLLRKGKLNVLNRQVQVQESSDPRIQVLCSFPNISKARAEKLINEYRSIGNALLDIDNWYELKIGLTKERCARIKATMYEESEVI